MFRDSQTREKIDVSKWDMSSATGISSMFQNAHKLKYVNVSHWDVSKVKFFQWFLSSANELTYIPDVGSWKTGSGKDF